MTSSETTIETLPKHGYETKVTKTVICSPLKIKITIVATIAVHKHNVTCIMLSFDIYYFKRLFYENILYEKL